MILIRTVTQYAFPSSVTINSDKTELLSQLKEFSELNQQPQFLTRGYWADQLDVHRRTIQRWEEEIIEAKPKFAYLYYEGNKLKNRRKIDAYQRFFLSLICALKRGWITGMTMTNQEVIDYLEAKEGMKPRWMGLTRQEFQKWDERHSQQRSQRQYAS